jgi:hypothetical protein
MYYVPRTAVAAASVRDDFNGDGKSDILYHNPVTGRNFMRLMNGRALLSQGNAPSLPAAWVIVNTN